MKGVTGKVGSVKCAQLDKKGKVTKVGNLGRVVVKSALVSLPARRH